MSGNMDLLEAWGKSVLEEKGYSVSETQDVNVELTTEGDGCCSECYSESAVIKVTSGKNSVTVYGLW